MSAAGGPFFELFRRSAWRLETRPFYAPDADEFGRATQGLDPTADQQAARRRWIQQVTAAGDAGRVIGRVLVVDLPLTPYWRWRLGTAAEHAQAGERIHVADRSRHPELASLAGDFWLFDEQWVVLLDYQPDGVFLGGRDTAELAVVERCQAERGLAVACSLPLEEFLQATR